MADLLDADAATQDATTEGTNKKQSTAFNRWEQFLSNIGLRDDPFMDGLTITQRHRTLGAFAAAMQEGRYSADRYDRLVVGTVTSAMDNVALTFWFNDRKDPRLDEDGKTSYLLQRQS